MPKPQHTRRPAGAALRKTRQLRRSKPAIDLGVLNDRLGYFARRVQVWIFQDFIRRLATIDISPAQFSVLVVIGANAGLSQAELAATLGIERARLVRLLHRLEQRGLTQRLPSSADGAPSRAAVDARRPARAGAGQDAVRAARGQTDAAAGARALPAADRDAAAVLNQSLR